MTLVIHLVWGTVWGCWVARILKVVVVAVLLELLDTTSGGLVLTRNLTGGLVANGGKLNRPCRLRVASGGSFARALVGRDDGSAGTIIFLLALSFLLLLAGLPLLANLLEFYKAGYVSVVTQAIPKLWYTHASFRSNEAIPSPLLT